MVVLTAVVRLIPTTIEPVWHKGPQILHSVLGLIVGLMKLGNPDGEVKPSVLVVFPSAVLLTKVRLSLRTTASVTSPGIMRASRQ